MKVHDQGLLAIWCLFFINLADSASNKAPSKYYPLKAQRNLEPASREIGSSRIRGVSKERNVFGEAHDADQEGRASSSPAQGDLRTFEEGGKTKKKGNKGKRDDLDYESIPQPSSEDELFFVETSEDFSNKPAKDPTSDATDKPSIHPTESPQEPQPAPTLPSLEPGTSGTTFMPTNIPILTQTPTSFATPTPVPLTTQTPMEAPADEPTLNPSIAPPQPSLTPTAVPPKTSQPSQSTSSPNPIPAPTSPDVVCRADEDGDFGSMNGDATEVEYLYQVELFPGVTIQEASDQIDKEVVNFLLSDLFPNDCAPTKRLNRVDDFGLVPVQVGFYNGITATPQDTLATRFECVGVFLEPCFVVRGWVTVFSEEKPIGDVEYEVSSAIHDILDNRNIEKELIDVDKVTSLRDPDLTAQLDSSDFPEESTIESSQDENLRSFQQAPLNKNSTSLQSTNSSKSSSPVIPNMQVRDERPFILTLPWWIWLCITVWVIAMWSLKTAICVLFQREEDFKHQQPLVLLE